jgi:hypothetical protein
MGCLLLMYFRGISRPIPEIPDPLSSRLWYSHPRGYPRVSRRVLSRAWRERSNGQRRRQSRRRWGKETAAGKGGANHDGTDEILLQRLVPGESSRFLPFFPAR